MFSGLILLLCISFLQYCTAEPLKTQVIHDTRTYNSSSIFRSAPAGFEYFTGVGYYRFYNEKRTWGECVFVCQSVGAHLTVINSDAEAEVLKKIFARHTDKGKYLWTGFHDILMEDEYLTIYNQPVEAAGYLHWETGYPKSNANNNCGAMNQNMEYINADCATKLYYICEA